MIIESFPPLYAYIAIFLGTVLEGEVFVIIGGFLANLNHLNFWVVALIAFLGSFIADQFFFYIGRTKGKKYVQKESFFSREVRRIDRMIDRFPTFAIIGAKFLYGLKSVSATVIGTSNVDEKKFLLWNIIGSLIWAIAVTSIGFFFGLGLSAIFGKIKKIELEIIIGVVILWLIIISIRFFRAFNGKGKHSPK